MIELLNCNCIDYMSTLSDKAFDLAIVDPPYFDGPNKLGFYGARKSSSGVFRPEYKKIGNWNVPDENYFNQLIRVSKQQIIWGINYYPIKNIGTGRIVWDKVNGSSTFSDCEIAYCSMIDHVKLISYMWNGMLQGVSVRDGKKMQGNKSLNEKRIHPTQKPVKLYSWMLQNYAKPGQRILDTHLGSGSSAIAAHYFGCDFVGCETDKDYYEASVKRFNMETRQVAFDFNG